MFCQKCGTQIPNGSAFCNSCGTAQGNVVDPSQNIVSDGNNKNIHKARNLVIISFLSLAFFASLIIDPVYYFSLNRKSSFSDAIFEFDKLFSLFLKDNKYYFFVILGIVMLILLIRALRKKKKGNLRNIYTFAIGIRYGFMYFAILFLFIFTQTTNYINDIYCELRYSNTKKPSMDEGSLIIMAISLIIFLIVLFAYKKDLFSLNNKDLLKANITGIVFALFVNMGLYIVATSALLFGVLIVLVVLFIMAISSDGNQSSRLVYMRHVYGDTYMIIK